ncbi:TetR/AcrR family transcriptional regulator [Mycetocola tolaasinivorans]|uniref:TetR/AcrR family transcriptional regulator n=1 Tax=Mycetocola tolaasinivorans TaxID=76635 RepID=A0A3L7AAG6_9MICO|nr:TetR/AcrR family transcriptional regulator [Mycetocola tolaasinivorans]RLP76818.1 TetR/AcrR family transcriptional regulator [Mycetocola tolaasinivorans]
MPTPPPAETPEGIQCHPTGTRSDRIHESVLRATEEILTEGGYPAATVDAIAARSGVSKATIYKHWPSRTAVAAKAFGRLMAHALPLPDTGDSAQDLIEQVRRVSAFYASDLGAVFAQLLAACVDDPTGAAYFREYFLGARRAAIAELWQRALDRGDADPTIPIDDVIDILFGPLIFRRLTGHHPLDEASATTLARNALSGLLPATPASTHHTKDSHVTHHSD